MGPRPAAVNARWLESLFIVSYVATCHAQRQSAFVCFGVRGCVWKT